MNYNFHTHTFRCGHATGSEEEYILWAIKNGVKYMGFADHFPLKFADGREFDFRVPEERATEYCETVKALREKYNDQISIFIGFEMEYYEDLFDEMLEKARSYGAEYLLLGQHYYIPENIDTSIHSKIENTDVKRLREYVNSIVKALDKNVYTYVAHPDVFNFVGDKSVYKEEMRKIAIASREKNVPLEINFLGIRENRYYPNPYFLEVLSEEKCPVTFGCDAHEIESAFDKESLKKAECLVKEYSLNYIGKPEIKYIQEL